MKQLPWTLKQLPLEPISLAAIQKEGCGLVPFRQDLGDLDPLASSIWQYGLMSPPVVWKTVDRSGGKGAAKECYILIEGNRRVAAIRQLQKDWTGEQPFPLDTVTCSVREGRLDGAGARLLSIQAHVNRNLTKGTNRGDEAVAVTWLLDVGWEPYHIEDMLGVSQPWVAQLKALAERLTPDSMKALRTGEINMPEALKLVYRPNTREAAVVERQNAALAKLLGEKKRKKAEKDAKRAK